MALPPPAGAPQHDDPVLRRTGVVPDQPGLASITDVTRLLCGACYYDAGFQQGVLELAAQRHRSIGRSPGADVARIVKHAVAARSTWRTRDALVVAALTVSGLLVLANGGPALLARNFVFLVAVVLVGKVLIPVVPRWVALTIYVVGALLALRLLGSCVVAAALVGVNFWHLRSIEDKRLAPLRTGEEPPVPTPGPRFDEAIDAAPGALPVDDLIVASGYWPFVGAGKLDKEWGIATTTGVALGDADIEPFTEAQLVKHLRQQLQQIELPSKSVRQVTVVDGRDVERIGLFDDTTPERRARLRRPVRNLPANLHPGPDARGDERLRTYLRVEAGCWGDHVVTSAFVRPIVREGMLYIEAAYCVLPPLREHFDLLDKDVTSALRRFTMLLGRSMSMAFDVTSVWRRWTSDWRWARAEHAALEVLRSGGTLDHGATITVRDLATGRFTRYFQKADADRFVRVVDRHVFAAVADFLRDHNIDSAEFRNQTMLVVEKNVISGGVFAGPVAQGRRAKAQLVGHTADTSAA